MYFGYDRFGVAWIPHPDEPLARLGRDWSGWCADEGRRVPHPLVDGLGRWAAAALRPVELTGLALEIVSPRPLANPGAIWQLDTALLRAAALRAGFEAPPLVPAIRDGRVVLAAERPVPALAAIGRAVTEQIGGFLAGPPAFPCGAGMRLALSGPTDRVTAARLMRRLVPSVEALEVVGPEIRDIALIGDPGLGRPVRVLARFGLGRAMASAQGGALELVGGCSPITA